MKKVLVTGAGGFVGRHCLPILKARGYEVHAVATKAQPDAGPSVRWHVADLLDREQTESLLERVKPTHLLHLAWYTAPGRYWTAFENLDWVGASLQLLKAFPEHGGRRVVVAGTCAEYDWGEGLCSEKTTRLAPSTLYGACKHALELVVGAYARQRGLSAAWGRLFFLYGPHEHRERLVSSVILSLLRRQPAACTHGQQVRDFLYVKDAADGLVALLDSEVRGAVNVASGEPVRLRDVTDEIATQLHGADLVRLGARPAARGEPPAIVAEVTRLRDEVGWSPGYDLTRGLAETIDWWRLELDKDERAGEMSHL
jgi:nucleoside-diphosphate-sugar epimerase